ncbi:hypothetical protein PENTCL1PPCAC_27353, partial [Pristionchus entomophagus]
FNRLQSYFGFAIAMGMQLFLSLIVLLLSSIFFIIHHRDIYSNYDYLQIEIFCMIVSLAFSIYASSISALAIMKKSSAVLRVFQISVMFYLVYLVMHCVRFVEYFIEGRNKVAYRFGLGYSLVSIALLVFVLFKTSEMRVSFLICKEKEKEPSQSQPPLSIRSGYGSDSSYVTAREHPL